MKWSKLIKEYWPQIILVLVVLIISIINFVPGKYLLSNDNYSPELNPSLTIERSILSPAWRSYRGLGVPSDSEQADVFRSIIYYVGEKFVGKENLSQVYAYGSMLLGVLFISLLSKKISVQLKLQVSPKIVSLISGILYISTLWTVWIYNFPVMPYISQFGLTPLLMYYLYTFIYESNWKNALKLLLASILFTTTSLISTLFIVTLIFLSVFVWSTLFDFKQWSRRFKAIIISLLIILFTQLFWILPFMTYISTSASEVQNSNINENITYSTIDIEKAKMTSSNSLRFYTQVLDIFDNDFSTEKMFTDSSRYYDLDLYKIISYIPLVFVAIGFTFALYYREFRLVPVFLLFVIGWFGLKNSNPPFGNFYEWLQENSDIYRQIFRWPSSKFGTIYLVGLSLLSSIGFGYFATLCYSLFKNRSKLFIMVSLVVLFVASQFIFASFLFSGSLIASRSYTDIPTSYLELKDYLKDSEEKRIVQFPPPNNGYFREFDFGFYGSGFLHYIIPNPILEKSLSVGSSLNENAITRIENAYHSEDFEQFDLLLNKYEVSYILVDREQIRGRYGEQIDWDQTNRFLSNYQKEWESDNLTLFSLLNSDEVSNKLSTVNNTKLYHVSVNDEVEVGKVTGTIYPLSLKASEIEIGNSYVTLKLQDRFNQGLSPKVDEIDWTTLPTSLLFDSVNYTLTLYPALPQVSNLSVSVPAVRFGVNILEYDYIVIGNNAVSVDDLRDEIVTVDTLWSRQPKINFSGDSKIILNYLDNFNISNPLDCANGKDENVFSTRVGSGVSLRANGALGCLSTAVEISERYIARFDGEWSSDVGGVGGYCLFSGEVERCLNGNRFYKVNDGGLSKVSETLPTLLDAGSSYSLNLYAPANQSENEITFSKANIELYSLAGVDIVPSYLNSFTPTPPITDTDDSYLYIPIIQGVNNYSLKNEYTWEFSSESGSLSEFSDNQSNGFLHIADRDSIYQYNPLFYLDASSPFLYYFRGLNKVGYPSNLCIQHSDRSRCLASMLFGYKDTSEKFGVGFSEKSNSILTTSLRTQSYSARSENVLEDILIYPIPREWVEYSIQIGDEVFVNEVQMVNVTNSTVPYLYTSNLSSTPSVYSIPEAKSKYWNAYLIRSDSYINYLPPIIKPFALSLTSPLTERASINGWKQAWSVDDVGNNGIIYAFYTPNLYGYIGYIILASLGILIIFKTINEYRKQRKQGNK